MDIQTLARYPFVPEASAYLKDKGITLGDIVDSSAFTQARMLGSQRIMEALVEGQIREHAMGTEVEVLNELISYVVARIIVSCVGEDQILMERYSLAEAKLTQDRLESEHLDFTIGTAQLLGIDVVQLNAGEVSVHFTDYLKHSSEMRSQEWKLMNQVMDQGRVELGHKRLARLLQNAVRARIVGELPLPVNDHLIATFTNDIDKVKMEIEKRKAQFEKESYGKVSFLRLPPCMKEILDMMKKGQNVPHVGRFAITAFLHTIGMSNDEILSVFSTSPDFRQDLARYQIDHITGKSSGIEYLPPECSTMKTHGVCYNPDSLCSRNWMNHPLTYYSTKGKKRKRHAKPDEKKPDAPEPGISDS